MASASLKNSGSSEDNRQKEDKAEPEDGRNHPLRPLERPEHCHAGDRHGPSFKFVHVNYYMKILKNGNRLFVLHQIQSAIPLRSSWAGLAELRSVADTFDAVLRIAQIESRSRTAKFQPVDLKVLVRDIYETYDVIASDEGYRLGLQEPAAGCWINGDPDLIRQLLANLLANSMRHTPLGSSILIDLARQEDAVVLSVSDNGPGIPPEERGRVLDRFYRLEKSRTTVGSGLGLSMVKAIAELHGAQVELADNSPGLRVSVAVSASSAKSLERSLSFHLCPKLPARSGYKGYWELFLPSDVSAPHPGAAACSTGT